jgi:hypothetical protein
MHKFRLSGPLQVIAKELKELPILVERERQKEKSTWAAAFKKGGLS